MTHDEINSWLATYCYNIAYTIRPDGIVDVSGGVDLFGFQGTTFPIQFGKVDGYFYCADIGITTVTGMPQSIGGYFSCGTSNLTSLHGIHKQIKHIGGNFYCKEDTTHLLGLLLIDGITHFYIDEQGPIDDIFNKYVGTGDILSAQDELIDAGFIEQARL